MICINYSTLFIVDIEPEVDIVPVIFKSYAFFDWSKDRNPSALVILIMSFNFHINEQYPGLFSYNYKIVQFIRVVKNDYSL